MLQDGVALGDHEAFAGLLHDRRDHVAGRLHPRRAVELSIELLVLRVVDEAFGAVGGDRVDLPRAKALAPRAARAARRSPWRRGWTRWAWERGCLLLLLRRGN